MISNAKELEALVQQWGFLPFFKNTIPGFSIAEQVAPELWFAENVDGPWEWKGPIARTGSCFYGKFFQGKAGFVSREWFADFLNYRRDGYDFDARYEDGLVRHKDKQVFDVLSEHGSLLSKELRRRCNYRKGGNTGFDSVMTRLQMQGYVIIADFEYQRDRYGQSYGWGVARYSTPEAVLPEAFFEEAYQREPEESFQAMIRHISAFFPQALPEQITKIIRY